MLNVWSEAVFSWFVVLHTCMAEVEKKRETVNVIVIIIEPEICSDNLTRISEEH